MADAQVTAWLRCAGLSRFAPRFGAALVSPTVFLQLSPTDLDALGVDGPADRKRLSDLITELRRDISLPPLKRSPSRPSKLSSVKKSRSRHILSTSNSQASITNLDIVLHMTSAQVNTGTSDAIPGARVTVCVRKRPLSRKEVTSRNRDIVSVQQETSSLCVHELRERVDLTKYVDTHTFTFDRVFSEHSNNSVVYEGTAQPLVDALFAGGRGTCFAYGQTGAGKTFTMAGDGHENPGLYTLAVRDVFDRIRDLEKEQWRYADANGIEDFEPPDPPQVWISFFEIYASKLQDLLNRSSKLECREDANNEVQIVGLTEKLCEVEEEVLAYIDKGSAARSTGVTGANDDSSRSHAVFQIELRHPPDRDNVIDQNTAIRESLLRNDRSTKQRNGIVRGAEIGRLCFIDLAGSERGSDTASSTRQTRMEGAEINKSLLALKECIRAMDQRKDHTPFRGSKLTQVLKASFMGKNCRTVMIANISPAATNVEHTLNTLRYSDRVKEIKRGKGNNGKRSLGQRRATFSHGVGLRAGRETLRTSPSKLPNENSDLEMESDEFSPPDVSFADRRKAATLKDVRIRNEDVKPPVIDGPSTTMIRRPTMRTRPRESDASRIPLPSELSGESKSLVKARESRLVRRRTSRAPSMIPSRPSFGGTALVKAAQLKSSEENRLQRTNSGLRSKSFVENSSPNRGDMGKEDEELLRAQARAATLREAAMAITKATPAATRFRGKDPESKVDSSQSSSVSPDAVPMSTPRVPGGASQKLRPPRASNAAQSAMKYYMTTRKNELSEEDLLFASTDDLDVQQETAVVQERLGAVALSDESDKGSESKALPPSKPTAKTEESKPAGIMTRSRARKARVHTEKEPPQKVLTDAGTQASTGSANSDSPSRSFSDGTPSGSSKSANSEIKNVIRMHHMQIEELMRLTESDLTLVASLENGEMDAQDYALKLNLNLSQKMDIVKTLQEKLKVLM